jgi:hypothetical protein
MQPTKRRRKCGSGDDGNATRTAASTAVLSDGLAGTGAGSGAGAVTGAVTGAEEELPPLVPVPGTDLMTVQPYVRRYSLHPKGIRDSSHEFSQGLQGWGLDVDCSRCAEVLARAARRLLAAAACAGDWVGLTLFDVFSTRFKALSVDYVRAAIAAGLIRVNGEACGPDRVLRGQDWVVHTAHVHEPPVPRMTVAVLGSTADGRLLAVNKPAGVPVRAGGGRGGGGGGVERDARRWWE